MIFLRFQFLAFAFCKDLRREECINPETIHLDTDLCKNVTIEMEKIEKQESQLDLEDGNLDYSSDSNSVCPTTDCYDYNGDYQYQDQRSFSFRETAKPITRMSNNGQEAYYGYTSSNNANCHSADSSSESETTDYPVWTANGAGQLLEINTLPPFIFVPFPEDYDSNYTDIYGEGTAQPGSFIEDVTYPDYNYPYGDSNFPFMGRKFMETGKETRAETLFTDSHVASSSDYSSTYNTYPRCPDDPELSSSVDNEVYNFEMENTKKLEDLKKLSKLCDENRKRFIYN